MNDGGPTDDEIIFGADLSGLEIVQNAQINFGNVAKFVPSVASSLAWQVATDQLRNGIKKLEAEAAAREKKE